MEKSKCWQRLKKLEACTLWWKCSLLHQLWSNKCDPAWVWARSTAYTLRLCSLVFLWTPICGSKGGISLTLLAVLGALFLLKGCLIHCAYSYFILLCLVQLISLGRGLFFSEGKQNGADMGENQGGGTERRGGKGNWSWDLMYEQRLKKGKKKSNL